MNRKFYEFFTNYNMKIEGNHGYGVINGFETNVYLKMLDNVAPLSILFSCYITDENKRNLEMAIRNAKIKYLHFQFNPYGLCIGLNDITVGALLKRLPNLLNQFTSLLQDNQAKGFEYCPVCGEVLDKLSAKKCNIDQYIITMDPNCVENINAVLHDENEDFRNAPNNYVKGFLGAVIGGFVGAIIAIILYIAGYISSLSALVSIILGTFLYKKMNGKQNKTMIFIVTLTTIAFMVLSVCSIYIYAASVAAIEANLDMSALEAFQICMKDAEFSRLFLSDLGLTLLFTAIGVVYQIVALAKGIKRTTSIPIN